MGLLRSVAAVVLILAALSACGGGEGAASDGVLHGNSGTTTSSGGARLLFSSGFEGSIALSAPSLYGNGAWQDIVGTDSTTGSTWPGNIWGGGIRSQMIVDAPVNATTLGNYMVNRIETVTGRDGNPTKALYSELKQRGGDRTQDVLMLQPASEQGDMYVSFWIKLQPDLLAKMTPQTWSHDLRVEDRRRLSRMAVRACLGKGGSWWAEAHRKTAIPIRGLNAYHRG